MKSKTLTKERVKQSFKKFGLGLRDFAARNYLMLGYVVFATIIELTGVAVTSGKFYMTEPWLFITFLGLVCIISAFLPNHKSRYALFMTVLLINFILDLMFIIVFDSNGTVFDYAMINLRHDAMKILDGAIPINFAFVFVGGLLIAVYGVVGFKLIPIMPERGVTRTAVAIMAVLLALVVESDTMLIFFANYRYDSNDLTHKLYQDSTYSSKGLVGNFANELARGLWFSSIDGGDLEELEHFIYNESHINEPSYMHGIANDYNVVTILCESFEWFTFLCDPELYPNGFAKQLKLYVTDTTLTADAHSATVKGTAKNISGRNYTSPVTISYDLLDATGKTIDVATAEINSLSNNEIWEFEATATGLSTQAVSFKLRDITVPPIEVKPYAQTEALPRQFNTQEEITEVLHLMYPNLYRIYEDNSSVILDNSHALEKTDISENKSIIGNYPLYEYINYAYPENTIPYSLPNIMKNLFGVESNSFHDGMNTFYNRNVHHVNALGFNSYTSSEQMGITDSEVGIGELGERNLDSLMFDACKEQMFPTDRRFNTFITTITQHGSYGYRKNLQPYYDKMDELGILANPTDDNARALRYYCAAGMDLDKAIGIMLDYLDANDLADNTLIVMFGDHNAYYQNVSRYAKDITNTTHPNYTNLYRTPVMMKIGNYNDKDDDESNLPVIITKSTCVEDIYPTILDLLGVTTFSNLTYGTSAFGEDESVLYSRAYDMFVTDKVYFNAINNIIYKAETVDDAYIAEIDGKARTLLNKISHVNRIFASDFFKDEKREKEFYDNIRRLSEMP